MSGKSVEVQTRLRALRLARGLTQGELGKLAEVAQPDVSMFETGRKVPYGDQGERLSAVLGWTEGEGIGKGLLDLVEVESGKPVKVPTPPSEEEVMVGSGGPKREQKYPRVHPEMVGFLAHLEAEYGVRVMEQGQKKGGKR